MISVRLKFTKNGKIRFTSHRDLARIWERTLRVAGIPMIYSEGYSPRPRIAFGLALPTGSESDAEYIDFQIDDNQPFEFDLFDIPALLNSVLPNGLAVVGSVVLSPRTPSLQQAVTSCVWDITVDETNEKITEWVEAVLSAQKLVISRERKGKTLNDDLRPYINELAVCELPDTDARQSLRADLGTQPRSLRPSELARVIQPNLEIVSIRRHKQWIQQDGARLEPLEVGAAPVPHTRECAS